MLAMARSATHHGASGRCERRPEAGREGTLLPAHVSSRAARKLDEQWDHAERLASNTAAKPGESRPNALTTRAKAEDHVAASPDHTWRISGRHEDHPGFPGPSKHVLTGRCGCATSSIDTDGLLPGKRHSLWVILAVGTKKALGSIVLILFSGAIVVGLFLLVLRIANGATEISLPVLAMGGVVLLLVTLALVSVAFALFDLSDRTQALALPEGSIHAVVSLSLIVLFAILSVFLYQRRTPPAGAPDGG